MLVIGLMSGTSADGVDVALCRLEGAPPRLEAKVLAGATYPYPPELRVRVLRACRRDTSTVDEVCRLGFDLAEEWAGGVQRLLAEAGVEPGRVDLIGSHGQTVWHQVEEGRVMSTLQIGDAAVLAERTGVTVVSNFAPAT